jgi:hypothetical protein
MDRSDAALVAHSTFQFVPLPTPTLEYTLYRRMANRPMLHIWQQILLTYISNVAVVRILGEQMIKRLIFGGAHTFRDRLIPFIAIGKYRVHIKNNTAKIKDAVTYHVANSELRFGYVGGQRRVVHNRNIGSIVAEINLALGKAKNFGYWRRSAIGARRFSGTDQPL